MPVLGYSGSLVLQREAPSPAVIASTDLDHLSDTLVVNEAGFWTGDEVTLTCPRGLPLDIALGAPVCISEYATSVWPNFLSDTLVVPEVGFWGGDELPGACGSNTSNGPDCPDGYAMYAGSPWLVGSNRDHISVESSLFYKTSGDPAFYVTESSTGLTTSATLFIARDQLDRVAFYSTKAEALKGGAEGRVSLYNVDFGELTLTANVSDWAVQGMLQEWVLNLTANEVDATAVGEKFGDAVKSIVTGGGSLDFYVDREDVQGKTDATTLMRLLLLTEKGCKAHAEFWMISDRPESGVRLPGDLYYEAEFLVTSTAINTRATEIIAGSLNFVTVGDIVLQMGI